MGLGQAEQPIIISVQVHSCLHFTVQLPGASLASAEVWRVSSGTKYVTDTQTHTQTHTQRAYRVASTTKKRLHLQNLNLELFLKFRFIYLYLDSSRKISILKHKIL